MRKKHIPAGVVFWVFLLLSSCKALPPLVTEEAPPPVLEETPVEPLPAAGDETPEAVPPPPESTGDVPEPLDEPILYLAEAFTPEPFPPEEELPLDLPEPPPPALSEAAPAPETPPEPPTVSPPVAPPEAPGLAAASETPPEPPPVAPTVAPTEPPRFIRPAEDEAPPPEREEPVSPLDIRPALPVSPSPLTTGEETPYSRRIAMRVGQIVEIPFRGTGWVYLGEQDSRRGISYLSRRSDDEGQRFSLRAEEPGVYSLKFYKQDFIRDYILNDYVEVTVSPAPEAGAWLSPPVEPGLVVAEPRWPPAGESFLPESAVNSGEGLSAAALLPRTPPERAAPPAEDGGLAPAAPTAAPEPAPPETGSRPRPRALASDDGVMAVAPPAAVSPTASGESRGAGETEPDGYLRRAREEYQAGRTGEALGLLDQFRERFPGGSDEAWWLYGQVLEAPGQNRDIRAALDYYRRLIREYPQSPRYDEARRRIAYLERYYFSIP